MAGIKKTYLWLLLEAIQSTPYGVEASRWELEHSNSCRLSVGSLFQKAMLFL